MSSGKIGLYPHPFLIAFSGIDGAGKTTQIEYLSSYLQRRQLRVLQLSFWDHVAVWSRLRSGLGQHAVGIYCTPQAQASFTPKNHKHIRRWYLTVARCGLYFLDCMRLRYLLGSRRVKSYDVIIFDRYIYDQLANIYSQSLVARTYIKMVLKQAPRPDVAFMIDTQPAEAFARKPEYPLDFMYRNRRAFMQLREFCPEFTRISGGTAESMKNEVIGYLCRTRIAQVSNEEESEKENESAVMPSVNSCRVQNEPTESV
jgi:thymidylate kinase